MINGFERINDFKKEMVDGYVNLLIFHCIHDFFYRVNSRKNNHSPTVLRGQNNPLSLVRTLLQRIGESVWRKLCLSFKLSRGGIHKWCNNFDTEGGKGAIYLTLHYRQIKNIILFFLNHTPFSNARLNDCKCLVPLTWMECEPLCPWLRYIHLSKLKMEIKECAFFKLVGYTF